MIALAFAFALATAAGPDEHDLPRSLAAADPVAQKDDLAYWAGVHLGVAGMYDADHPAFVFGFNGRGHIMPWLGADVSVDFQTKQRVDDAASIFQVPFMFTGLVYPPLELSVRPYGQIGFGFTITDVSAPGRGNDDTDLNLLFHFGFGAEYELAPNILLDANLRFVFATDPPHAGDFDAHWIQFTLGIMIKLSQ